MNLTDLERTVEHRNSLTVDPRDQISSLSVMQELLALWMKPRTKRPISPNTSLSFCVVNGLVTIDGMNLTNAGKNLLVPSEGDK